MLSAAAGQLPEGGHGQGSGGEDGLVHHARGQPRRICVLPCPGVMRAQPTKYCYTPKY